MDLGINLGNLWIFYALAYAIAFPLRTWANAKRGEPIEDPELLAERKIVLVAALTWILSGFVISLFVPLRFGSLFYIGVLFYLLGIIIAGGALYSLANHRGLVTSGFYRYSRNPNYVGWTLVIFGRLVDYVTKHPFPDVFLRDYSLFPLDCFSRRRILSEQEWRIISRISGGYTQIFRISESLRIGKQTKLG